MSNASLRHDWDRDCGHDFFDHLQTGKYFERVWILSGTTHFQGCKLLSDIGQCPTKFGKCPSKSSFDRTLVRSQKKLSHYTFFAVTKSDANSLNLHFAIKFTRHSSILFNVAPEWIYILVS